MAGSSGGGGAAAAAPAAAAVPGATMVDLPPELLRRVFTHLFASAVPVCPHPVPYPAAAHDARVPRGPLVTRGSWALAAGAAGACRPLRAAFLDAVVALEFDPAADAGADEGDADGDGGDAAERAQRAVLHGTAFGVTLGRLRALRCLTLCLDGIPAPWAARAVSGLLLGLLALDGSPALHALTVYSVRPVLGDVGGLPRGQPRLHHLVLAADQEWELLPGAADRLVALCRALRAHLHSLDLSVLAAALGVATEGAFVRFFDRLPVLPAVRLVHTGSASPVSERMLAAVARVCPAVETLCCMGLLTPELDSAAGAAALLRLLPALRRLSCIQNYGYDDASVSTEFVAALCGGRRLASLAIVAAGTGGDHGGLPAALLGVDAPPEGLRHTGYLDEGQVAALAAAGLPGLRRLHLAAVALDKGACRALSRLADLRSLFLGVPNDGPLALEAASVLAPPALEHLYLEGAFLAGAAATGLVTALSLASPQTVRGLYLLRCSGCVEGALVAVTHLRSLRRLVVADHSLLMREEGTVEDSWQRVSVVHTYPQAVECLTSRRPDVVFMEEL